MKLIVSLSGEYIRYLKKKVKKGCVESQCTVAKYEIMYSLLNSKFNTCPLLFFEQEPPFSLQSDSRDSSNCSFWYTTKDCTAVETRSIQEESVSTLKCQRL